MYDIHKKIKTNIGMYLTKEIKEKSSLNTEKNKHWKTKQIALFTFSHQYRALEKNRVYYRAFISIASR
jgi:hypothetical protein